MDVPMSFCLLFVLTVISLLSGACCTSVCGGSANCNDLPRGRDVSCSIRPAEPCEVYVGMRVTLQCNMTGLALFHNGEPTNGSSESEGLLIIPYVRQEHGGGYDCRVVMDGMDFNMTVAERSLVVRQEALIATGPTFLSSDALYFCDETFMCCRTLTDVSMPAREGNSAAEVFQFNIYGEDPLDITIETIWLSDTYPVDLQIEWERDNSTSLQNLQIGQWPETIIELGSSEGTTPRVLLRISANNTLNSSSTCFEFFFRDFFPTLIANTSLPSNQTVMEGEEAVFECEVGSTPNSVGLNIITKAEIKITSPNQTSPIQVTCPFDAERCHCPSCERIQITGMRRIEVVTLLYDIEVRIPSANISDSGSVVACGLARSGVTHFRREAYLSVLPADLQQSPTPTPSPISTVAPNPISTSIPPSLVSTSTIPSVRPNTNFIQSPTPSPLLSPTSLPEPSMSTAGTEEPNMEGEAESKKNQDTAEVLVIIYATVGPSLLLFVMLVAVVAAVSIIYYRRRVTTAKKNLMASAPMRDMTVQPTIMVLENETAFDSLTPKPVPNIEVTSEEHGVNIYQNMRAGSIDSALAFDSEGSITEDVFPSPTERVQFKWYIGGQRFSPQALAPGMHDDTVRTSSLSECLEVPLQTVYVNLPVRIYVSYSDNKSEWVIDYLQPLIESFENTEVTIHDADMIAGQPISEERLRLILEADKVIIVCSPDYSDSPWCQFELYQAITKQPSLAEGKIIPILCDGCHSPPIVVRAVVTLSDKDERFAEKLKTSIFCPRRLSQS